MPLLIVSSFALGLAYCAPPGAVTAEAIRRGLARGFRAALLVELGSLLGDATWAALALGGAAFIVQNPVLRLALGLAGGGMLLRLAWSGLRDARHSRLPAAGQPTARNDFTAGAVLSLGNPFAIPFWLGVGSSTIAASVQNPEWFHFALFFLAFMLGAILWSFLLAGLTTWGNRLANPAMFRAVNLVCGLFLGYFGLQLLWNTLGQLGG